jgi:hypothetical protein
MDHADLESGGSENSGSRASGTAHSARTAFGMFSRADMESSFCDGG